MESVIKNSIIAIKKFLKFFSRHALLLFAVLLSELILAEHIFDKLDKFRFKNLNAIQKNSI